MATQQVQQQQTKQPQLPQGQSPNQQVYQMDQDMIGAIKIKDGLFIGDELASQDIEFVIANKVTHIINCAGKQIMNHWEPIGVAYLAFYWLDQDNQVVLDAKDEASNAIFDFIEEAVEQTESVLVHSVRGQSRATCTLAAYIMRKYRWSLLKSLEFLNSRRPDLEIRATFIHQLSAYEQRLQKKFNSEKFTSNWDDLSEQQPFVTSEELILRNTFQNARMGPLAEFNRSLQKNVNKKRYTLKWIDEVDVTRQGKKNGLRMNNFDNDLLNQKVVKKVEIHREKSVDKVKGTLRDRGLTLAQITGVKGMDKIFTAHIGGLQIKKEETSKGVDIKASQGSVVTKKKKTKDQDAQKRSQSSAAVDNSIISKESEIEGTKIKKKHGKSNSVLSQAKGQYSNPLRPSATPDMFYKKGDDVDMNDDNLDDAAVVQQKKSNHDVIVVDDEEDDQILNGIEVDDDEADSCSEENNNIRLKKDNGKGSDMWQRPNSGSKLRNQKSDRTRSIGGGSGGSRGSRTGQRLQKQQKQDQIQTTKDPQQDSLIAISDDDGDTPMKIKEKPSSSKHLWSKDGADKEKSILQRSNNFVTEPITEPIVNVNHDNTIENNQENQNSENITKTESNAISQASSQRNQAPPPNITNIINNNNINNYIINDPKAVAGLIQNANNQNIKTNGQTNNQQSNQEQTNGNGRRNQNSGSATAQTHQQNNEQQQQQEQRKNPNMTRTDQRGNPMIDRNRMVFGQRHGSNVRGVPNAVNNNMNGDDLMMYQTHQQMQGTDQQRQLLANKIKTQSKSPKMRHGPNGVIILNHHGVNFQQQQSEQQTKASSMTRELKQYTKGGADQQMTATNPSTRNTHKRSNSHQMQRGQANQQRYPVDNPMTQISTQIQNHAYGGAGGSATQQNISSYYQKRASLPSNQVSGGGKQQNVQTLVQKEMAKRHESPRSRRQIVGQFGPGGQQQSQSQNNAASVGWKKYNQQNQGQFQIQDQIEYAGVSGIGSVGIAMNMQDINKFFVGDQRTTTSHGKAGQFQARQNQGQNQGKFTKQYPQQSKTPSGGAGLRKVIDFTSDINNIGSGPVGNNRPQKSQDILNRTGPIKIPNRIGEVGSEDASLNNTLNLGKEKEKKMTSKRNHDSNKFNDSLNISDAQPSIQDPNGQNQAQKIMRFGNPYNQVTKVKRQLNIISTGQSQGQMISGNINKQSNNVWGNRNPSVKSRGAQQQKVYSAQASNHENSNNGNIFEQKNTQNMSMRPGTAPKQNSMINNMGDIHINYSSNTHGIKIKKESARPLSPYTKVYHQPNSGSHGNQAMKRRGGGSKRNQPQTQTQMQIISPQNMGLNHQRSGSTGMQGLQFHGQLNQQQRGRPNSISNNMGRMPVQMGKPISYKTGK